VGTRKSGLVTGALVVVTFIAGAAWIALRSDRPGRPAAPAAISFQRLAPEPPFSHSRAFTDLFGVQASDDTIATGPAESTSLWHQQGFVLGGGPARAVFTQSRQLDPLNRRLLAAEAPSMSAAAYRLADGQWKLAGASMDFARAGWGDSRRPQGPVQVLAFPSGAVAFLFDQPRSGHGYTQAGKAVWVFANGEWRDLGFVQTGGDNAGAATRPEGRFRFTGTVTLAPGTRTWPDLLVARSGTIRDEADRVVPVAGTRYVFTGKGYEEVLAKR
jgi:hypothetical protein